MLTIAVQLRSWPQLNWLQGVSHRSWGRAAKEMLILKMEVVCNSTRGNNYKTHQCILLNPSAVPTSEISLIPHLIAFVFRSLQLSLVGWSSCARCIWLNNLEAFCLQQCRCYALLSFWAPGMKSSKVSPSSQNSKDFSLDSWNGKVFLVESQFSFCP